MKKQNIPVFISEIHERKHPQAKLMVDTSILESEIFARIEHPDRDQVIDIATKLWPNRAFCFLNEQRLAELARSFQTHFLPDDPWQTIAYAVKANPRARILEILRQAGINTFDCASPGEIEKTLRFCPSATPLFTLPYKFPEEIAEALATGVRYFTVQARSEVIKILEVAEEEGVPANELEIAARLAALNEDADIDLSEKYGTDEATVLQLLFMISRETDAQAALSVNTGSQNRNPASYAAAVHKLVELARTVDGVSSINFGGGFPVNYHEGDQFSLEEYLSSLTAAVREHAGAVLQGDQPRVIIEPGRALVAEAVDLVIPVRGVEQRGSQRVVFIDDGVFTSLRKYFMEKSSELMLKTIRRKNHSYSTEKTPTTIYGRTCDSGDKLPQEPMLPIDLEEGDYLHLPNAGAYTDGQATEFNSFPPPQYITYNS